MKKIRLLLLISFLFQVAVFAQSKDEKKVADAVAELRKAMIDADKQKLESLVAEDLSYGHSSGKIEDKATFIESLVSGRSDFLTMDLTDQTIDVKGKTAIVRHNLTADTNDNGKTGTVKLGVMLVWQKESGRWKLLARQAFKL
jgi:ketosteroid isomerase-like protein